jgi:MoxR-like ATPase
MWCSDMCLVGDKGVGKSAVSRALARLVGLPVHYMYLYKDMTSREILQRRSTDAAGNTQWTVGPLVQAAIEGAWCVLDGVDRLPSAALAAIAQLVRHQEICC